AGSRAFLIPEAPVGGRGRAADGGRAMGRSISHPDFEPIWCAAEDLGMAAFAHVGFARERINAGWANNGADDLLTFNALNMLAGSQIGPQLLFGSLILDGVLERHPGLVVVAEEVGIDWLPHLVTTLEVMVGRTPEILHDGEYRPGNLERGGYRLPLTPTEYLQRQVRASPLPASQPIAGVLQQVPDLLSFCSDFPHVEGTTDAVAICERQLRDVDANAREAFFAGAGDLIGV
ncbi:MAG: amidohydrolase family protein, partial [Acidimicrobiales bacterium]